MDVGIHRVPGTHPSWLLREDCIFVLHAQLSGRKCIRIYCLTLETSFPFHVMNDRLIYTFCLCLHDLYRPEKIF